jgi:hypothetical protein
VDFAKGPIPETDEAIDKWGSAALGDDPLAASFTSEPYASVRPHIPFYRFFHYPDLLDLRHSGYELDRFIPLFDALENARLSQAERVRELMHRHLENPNPIWNPRRARETEFDVRAILHNFGLSEVPSLLRRMIGRAFPDDSVSDLTIDLVNVFFWAALAEVARDYAWRHPQLSVYADYLSYPVRSAGMHLPAAA